MAHADMAMAVSHIQRSAWNFSLYLNQRRKAEGDPRSVTPLHFFSHNWSPTLSPCKSSAAALLDFSYPYFYFGSIIFGQLFSPPLIKKTHWNECWLTCHTSRFHKDSTKNTEGGFIHQTPERKKIFSCRRMAVVALKHQNVLHNFITVWSKLVLKFYTISCFMLICFSCAEASNRSLM